MICLSKTILERRKNKGAKITSGLIRNHGGEMESSLKGDKLITYLQKLSTEIELERKLFPGFIHDDEYDFLVQERKLPKKFIGLFPIDFKEVIDSKEYGKIVYYIKNIWTNINSGRGLIFVGPVGTCKTALATVMLKMVFSFFKNNKFWEYFVEKWIGFIRVEETIAFWQSAQLLMDYFNDKKKFSSWMSVPFLAIDDITKVSQDIYKEALDFVLRHRDMSGLPTFITSQMPLSEFGDLFGLPILDIIVGNCEEIKLVGQSRRL